MTTGMGDKAASTVHTSGEAVERVPTGDDRPDGPTEIPFRTTMDPDAYQRAKAAAAKMIEGEDAG